MPATNGAQSPLHSVANLTMPSHSAPDIGDLDASEDEESSDDPSDEPMDDYPDDPGDDDIGVAVPVSAETHTGPLTTSESTPPPSVIVAVQPIDTELATLTRTAASLESDGDPLALLPILRLRIADLTAQQEVHREIERKKDSLITAQARFDALLAHITPETATRIMALQKDRDTYRQAALVCDQEALALVVAVWSTARDSAEAQALAAEIAALKRAVGSGPSRRKAREPTDRGDSPTPLHPRVWSEVMVRAAESAGLLPHDPADAVTLPDFFDAVEASGCLVPLLHPGQTFTRFSTIASSKGQRFQRACTQAGLAIEVVDGTAVSGTDIAARYWFRLIFRSF